MASNSRRWWRNSAMAIHLALPNSYFDELGVPLLSDLNSSNLPHSFPRDHGRVGPARGEPSAVRFARSRVRTRMPGGVAGVVRENS